MRWFLLGLLLISQLSLADRWSDSLQKFEQFAPLLQGFSQGGCESAMEQLEYTLDKKHSHDKVEKYTALVTTLCKMIMGEDWSYYLGKKLGQKTTRKAWKKVSKHRHCDAADDLMDVISASIKGIKQTIHQLQGQQAVSFVEGFVHGLRYELADIAKQCAEKCAKLGEITGEITALVYCEVADVIQGTPYYQRLQDQPNITCGEPYKISCEANFLAEVDNTPQCHRYTSDQQAFDEYYRSDLGGSCAYTPKQPEKPYQRYPIKFW